MQKKKIIINLTSILGTIIILMGLFLTLFFCLNKTDSTIYAYTGTAGENGLYYTLNADNSSYTLTDCDNTIAIINIPSTFNGYPVTAIGLNAFVSDTKLTKITIPSTITGIGDYAFQNCTALTVVNFSLNSTLTTIGTKVFLGCTSLTSIVIPNSVTSLGTFSFSGCTDLSSVTLSNNISSIQNSTFYN